MHKPKSDIQHRNFTYRAICNMVQVGRVKQAREMMVAMEDTLTPLTHKQVVRIYLHLAKWYHRQRRWPASWIARYKVWRHNLGDALDEGYNEVWREALWPTNLRVR